MSGLVIDRNLFDYALINPLKSPDAVDTLRVVSGYATHAMASRHLLAANDIRIPLYVDLVYGMAGSDGVSREDHTGFVSLERKDEFDFRGQFNCSYVKRPYSVHSKVYVWCKGEKPVQAFIGSANYSQRGFSQSKHVETLAECDPVSALEFFHRAKSSAVDCVKVNQEKDFPEKLRGLQVPQKRDPVLMIETDARSPYKGCLKIVVSLLIEKGTKAGSVGDASRLNWGVRADGLPRRNKNDDPRSAARNPNQAYIALPTPIQKSGFFPAFVKGRENPRFTVLTDDGKVFSCVRASGDYGKEIETPQDNSELGRYFRNRLGLPSGAYITAQDLKRYGRYDVVFYKLDDERYVMDFSRPQKS